MKKKFLPLFFLFAFVAMNAQSDTSRKANKEVTNSIPVKKETMGSNQTEFFIINDKPATKEEYLQYLKRKEEEKRADPKKEK